MNTPSTSPVPPAFAPVAFVPAPSLEDEVAQLSDALVARFEELSLIHELSESLTKGFDSAKIVETLLQELSPCIACSSLTIILHGEPDVGVAASVRSFGVDTNEAAIRELGCAAETLTRQQLGEDATVAVANNVESADGSTARVIVVPIQQNNSRLGEMVAIREMDAPEFGTTEADLMKSTAMMLAIHLINQHQYLELQQMFESTVESLVSALDAKDAYTCGHSQRVAELTVELAKRLGYDEEGIARVRMGGVMHDIGKIGVDDAVLRKPGRLTDEEFEKIKEHPVLGYEILKGIRQFKPLLPAVRHHHESWDGTGYPDGLAGDDIPRDAQIMAVADAFDAMTSDRPYRSGMPLEKVIGIFSGGRGKQWAADVVDVLLNMPEVMERYARREADIEN